MLKKYKKSKRGLTFSLESQDFPVGSRFIYRVNKNVCQIKIFRSESGNTVSRKKTGNKIKSLFDLRSKQVMDLMEQCDYFEIEQSDHTIIVRFCRNTKVSFMQKKRHDIGEVLGADYIGSIILPEEMIKKVSGGEPLYTQMTISDFLQIDEVSKKQLEKDIPMVYNVISLFSGAGMLDKPFTEDPAFELVYAIDNEPAACESYRKNIGAHIECRSICDVKAIELPDAEVIIGGPSCKAFSNANRRTRLKDHNDYWLLNEYLRITQDIHPEVFIIENVPEFITANEGEMLKKVISESEEYEVTSTVVMDADLGGYTMRKRAIIIGSRIGRINLPNVKVLPYKTVKEALSKVNAEWFNYSDVSKSSAKTIERMKQVPPGGNFKDIPELAVCNSHSGRYKRLHPDQLCPTLVNWRKLPLIHPTEDRILSVAEAIALSGFGKDFEVCGTLSERQQQVGNGVPYAIGRTIKNAVKKALNHYFCPDTLCRA